MQKLILGLCLSTAALTAYAMPNEFGYLCVSKSKKVKIAITSVTYKSALELKKISLGGTTLDQMKLTAGYDGLPLQGNLLTFMIQSLDPKNTHTWTVESQKIPSSNGFVMTGGTVRLLEQGNAPAQPRILVSEPVICTLLDRSELLVD